MRDWKPKARRSGLIFETLDDELLVYDSASCAAHSLQPQAARIFAACDGTRTLAAVAHAASVDPAIVEAVVTELLRRKLVEYDVVLSRRAALSAAVGGVTWDPLESTCRHASLSIL